jgi:hypothetical protein
MKNLTRSRIGVLGMRIESVCRIVMIGFVPGLTYSGDGCANDEFVRSVKKAQEPRAKKEISGTDQFSGCLEFSTKFSLSMTIYPFERLIHTPEY